MASNPQDALKEFDIKKYDACSQWGAHEWQMALTARIPMRHFLRTLKHGMSKVKLPRPILLNERERLLKKAEDRLKDPLATPTGMPYGASPVIIKDLSFRNLFYFNEIADKVETSGIDLDFDTRFTDAARSVKVRSNTFYLSVNLNASDVVIKEKFDNWLRMTRSHDDIQEKFSGKLFNENDFSNWHSQRLLPFLDLILWSKLSGRDLTQDEMGDMLFPLLFGAKDRVKSMPKKALKLISRENISRLEMSVQTY